MIGRGLAARASTDGDPWDEIWASYDAAHGAMPAHSFELVRIRRRAGRVPRVLLSTLALLLMAASAFAAAPSHAARELTMAFRAADRAAVAALVDWSALRSAAPVPAEGSFLSGLSRSVQERSATPEGLMTLVQARMGSGWSDPEVVTTGLGTARVILASTSQPGRGIVLSLVLQGYLPPRWRVVAVETLG